MASQSARVSSAVAWSSHTDPGLDAIQAPQRCFNCVSLLEGTSASAVGSGVRLASTSCSDCFFRATSSSGSKLFGGCGGGGA